LSLSHYAVDQLLESKIIKEYHFWYEHKWGGTECKYVMHAYLTVTHTSSRSGHSFKLRILFRIFLESLKICFILNLVIHLMLRLRMHGAILHSHIRLHGVVLN
jgi:hypothetical protein